jgi:poly(A) polymerase
MDLGVPHGPRIGILLAEVESWWEERDYRPGRGECLDRLRALIAGGL